MGKQLIGGVLWLMAVAVPIGVANAQTCPLQAVPEATLAPLLKDRNTLVGTHPTPALAFQSAVERDDDGAPNAYHRGLPTGPGRDDGLDHICAGGSVMEFHDGRLVDRYAKGGSIGTLEGHSPECKRDYIAIRDAKFPACGPGRLCMLWYGIASEKRRCGYPNAFGGAEDERCGAPILQEGREFYLTTTALTRPGSPSGSRVQSDYVDAATIPYAVLPGSLTFPGGMRWQAGDLGAMLWKGKVVHVVVGDTGPSKKIGEASRAALAALTGSGTATIGAGSPATTLIFPGTRDLVADHWPLQPARIKAAAEKLVASLPGGTAGLAKCTGFAGLR